MKITSSRITTLLTIGENLNIEFKRAGNGPKAEPVFDEWEVMG